MISACIDLIFCQTASGNETVFNNASTESILSQLKAQEVAAKVPKGYTMPFQRYVHVYIHNYRAFLSSKKCYLLCKAKMG